MGQYRMGPPEALVLALQRRLGISDFIETGTYRGETAAWAARHFARVTTVELSVALQVAAQERFRTQPNVRTMAGDSSVVLRGTIDGLNQPAIFWLDAHWSGLETAGREAECPVLAEISIINRSPLDHAVLIDDARLFCAPPPRPHRAEQWPDLITMVNAMGNGGRRHLVLFEDVFVAVPFKEREFLNDWLQSQTGKLRDEGRLTKWWKKLRT